MLSFKKERLINSDKQIVSYKIISSLDSSTNNEIYSVNISIQDNEPNGAMHENESSFNLSYSLEQMQDLLLVLYSNAVMPSELHYVIDDYISDNPNFIYGDSSNIVPIKNNVINAI